MRRQDPWPPEYYTGTCGKGHERSPENTRIRRQNGAIKRDCRVCRAARESERPKPERDHQLEWIRSKERRGEALTLDEEILKGRGRTRVFPGPEPEELWRPASWRKSAAPPLDDLLDRVE